MRRRWLRRILILLVVAAAIVVLRLTVFRSEPVPVTVYRTGAGRVEETVPGPSSALMAEMAERYEMYVAGGIVRRVPELVASLARLARRAVVVDYPTRRSVNAVSGMLFALKHGVEGDTRPFTVFSDRELEAAFAAHGFAPTGRRPQFLAPMALYRTLGSAGFARAVEGAAAAAGLTRALGSPVVLRLERRG